MNSTELIETIEQEDLKIVKSIAKKHKLKMRLIAVAVVCVLLLAVFAGAWIAGNGRGKSRAEEKIAQQEEKIASLENEIKELMENPIVVSPAAPKIVLDEIYKEINNIGELATVEYLFTDTAVFSDSKQIKNWNIPFTEKSFTVRWDGRIKAGIDITGVSIEVNEEAKNIIVNVPAATILSYEIFTDSVEVFDEKNNVFNPISIEDKVEVDAKSEDAMRERAIDNGLLEKAQENAENILRSLLTTNPAILDMYEINFVVGE